MLRRTMNATSLPLQHGLEDLLGDLKQARRSGDLGRLALLTYCEIRRWARVAGQQEVAQRTSQLITHTPHASREDFMAHIDGLIVQLERARLDYAAGDTR